MDDLIAWLTAQLDEDEQVAKAASGDKYPGPDWGTDDTHGYGVYGDCEVIANGDVLEKQAVHIARHDPARVLREVEAKRRMLDEHISYYSDGPDDNLPVRVPTLLALTYADRPGYRPEWAPTA